MRDPQDIRFSKSTAGWAMVGLRNAAILGIIFGLVFYGVSYSLSTMDTGNKLALAAVAAIIVFVVYKLWRATPASSGGGRHGH